MNATTEPYPYNLLDEILGTPYRGIVDDDIQAGIAYIINGLSDRERCCIIRYYCDGENYDDVGKAYGITRERVRQIIIKAVRKLAHPSRTRYITKGYNVASGELDRQVSDRYAAELAALEAQYEAKVRELREKISALDARFDGGAGQTADEIMAGLDTPIETFDFSVRTYNVLHRAGIKTVVELCGKSYAEICALRNMGKRSAQEVQEKLAGVGLRLRETTT